ncbi:TPA: HEPN domain-containing protein [Candidatus Woesearchaeota archaeon]|nr:HEPN domain-containing protein [Candidatus Woesearchaeota archaeon]
MEFDRRAYADLFKIALAENRLKKSSDTFKIKLFLDKAESSLLIAKHIKEINPTQDQPPKRYWDYWAITVSYYSMLYAAKAAILSKGYEVSTHDTAQIALGHLLVPDELEKADLEILNQSHKIFEEEYVHDFEDAKTESHIARYSAIKTYTERRLQEVFDNATEFVAKIALMLEDNNL